MPIYMDVHFVPGVKARAVAEAHRLDLQIEDEHQCKCMTYWIDEVRESVFCLIEAPDKEAVNQMHGRAHGLIPHKIIEVSSTLVGSFLGRLFDPVDAVVTDDGLKIFHDPSFRVLLSIKTGDPVLLKHRLGIEKAESILSLFYTAIRKNLIANEGREVEEKGPGLIASFASASNAIACALAIGKELSGSAADIEGLRIAINAGQPVGKTESLFGEAIQLAKYMCEVSAPQPIVISSEVRELIAKDLTSERKSMIMILSPQDEALLTMLYQNLEENWQDPSFDVAKFSRSMAMSKSQLYRKTISLIGTSPVLLLKDFRLGKAKEIMRGQHDSISAITFASGFTSPSYFTKCFKKKFDLLPMQYVELLD